MACSQTGYNHLDDDLYAEITTNRGIILIKLTIEETPGTMANLVGLVEAKIRNQANGDTQDFMIQQRILRILGQSKN
jgi:cyclophilin family peptidyl-prolyl cis-trans isomerase